MVVPVIGSMAVKGIFKAGSLLSGLGNTSGKLKEVQQRSKSTTTEMSRMTQGANQVKTALAAIGVAGFSALLMTTPQLAGSLAKIKSEMQRIAWSIGKHLKPSLDAVGDILRGIRTGDWSVVKQGIVDLTESVLDLVAAGTAVVIDVIFGEGSAEEAETDFNTWWENLNTAYKEGDLGKFAWTLVAEPVIWAAERISEWLSNVAKWVGTSEGKNALLEAVKMSLPVGVGKSIDFASGWGKGGTTADESGLLGEGQVGIGNVPRTGMYKLHQGETVTMKGASEMGGVGGTSNITVDFSNSNINLSGGIQLDQFADVISMKIAERQNNLSY